MSQPLDVYTSAHARSMNRTKARTYRANASPTSELRLSFELEPSNEGPNVNTKAQTQISAPKRAHEYEPTYSSQLANQPAS